MWNSVSLCYPFGNIQKKEMEDSNLTIGEISSLVGVTKKEISKYIESKAVTAKKLQSQYLLPKQAVLFFTVICKNGINILSHSSKKEIWNKLLDVIDTSTGVEVQGKRIHFGPRIRDIWRAAKRYINLGIIYIGNITPFHFS